MVRLERGGAEFLVAVGRRLFEMGAGAVFSPALYPGSTRVWRKSGFDDYARLDVMERSLDRAPTRDRPVAVEIDDSPEWNEVVELDRVAFEGFWGMSRLGLEEAHGTNRDTALMVTRNDHGLTGYCIVGSQWGTVYLHRIAVQPEHGGQGIGAALVGAAVAWGVSSGGKSMVLNVRPENQRAKRLYGRFGFTHTGTALEVLRQRPV